MSALKILIRMFGPSNAVVFELRPIISNQKWANAWFVLCHIGLRWFIIMDIVILAKQVQSNLSLRTPLYYGQFVQSQKCKNTYIPYLYNTDTSVKRTNGSVPLVSVLKRFDCSILQRSRQRHLNIQLERKNLWQREAKNALLQLTQRMELEHKRSRLRSFISIIELKICFSCLHFFTFCI